jgi:hypothetical protein
MRMCGAAMVSILLLLAPVHSTDGRDRPGATPARATAPASASAPASRPAAQTAPADDAKVQELLRQLGDKEYKVRAEATRQLAAMGAAAHPALQAKLKESGLDPEAASRIRGILEDWAAEHKPAPVVVGGVTVSVDPRGALVGARNGATRWMVDVPKPILELKVEDGHVVVLPGNIVIDPQTGRILEKR